MAGINTEETLGRSLGFFPTFAIGTGTMIGAGIFVLPGIASASAGPAAILSFILGGMISMATALSMAELATGMPRAGGSYYFISRAMGAVFGSIIGIGAWFALVFKGSFALVGLAEYLNIFLPAPILGIAIVAGLILLTINYRGAESSGSLQNYIVIGLFVILAVFIVGGSFSIETENMTPFIPYGGESILLTTGLIFVSYLGITQLAAISEEVKNPSVNLPRAFIASVATVTVLYVGVMLVINGVLPMDQVVNTSTPLVDVADLLAGNVGRIAIIIAGFFATVSTANAAILSSSRFPFAMGRDELMPQWFVDIHEKFETPYRAIVVTGLAMIVLLLLFNVEQLAKLGSTFNVLIFVLINISALILRYRSQAWYNPEFRDPLFPFTQIFGIIGSLMLLPQLGTLSMVFAIAIIVLGSVWYKVYAGKKAEPGYNLFDLLEDEEVPVAIDETEKRVIVPVSNPKHEADLLHLADLLGDVVIGLNVIKVPPQTSLRVAKEEHFEEKDKIASQLKERFETCLRGNEGEDCVVKTSREQNYLVVFDHDVSSAILEQSEAKKADLTIMGWKKKNRFQYAIGGITNKILSHAKNHVAVLKGHFPEKLNKVTIAFDGNFNSRYGVYLAKRLALNTEAEIELLRVIDPDLAEDEKAEIISELEEIVAQGRKEDYNIYYTLEKKYSRVDTILEATKNTDLTIIGDSTKRFRRSFLGTLPQKVGRHTEEPVLIVKRYRPISKETVYSFFAKLRNKLK